MKSSAVCILLTVVLAFAAVGLGRADVCTNVWDDLIDGGNGDDYTHGVAIDSQGRVIAVGYQRSLVSPEQHDSAYIKKYTAAGGLDWDDLVESGPIGGSKADSYERFYDVAVDSQDNVIAVGIISGTWTGYTEGSYNQAMLIRKYDPDGGLIWERIWQEEYTPSIFSPWQGAWGVAVDEDDNIYISGYSFGYWDTSQFRWVIKKYDPAGNITLGPIFYNYGTVIDARDYAYDIAVDHEGGITAVGIRGGSASNFDWHVRRYDAAGSLVWEDSYGGGLHDLAHAVAVDEAGDVYVTGHSNKGTDNGANADYDWVVIKYSKDGITGSADRLWTRTFESAPGRSEGSRDILVDPEGMIIVGGYARDVTDAHHWRLEKLDPSDGTLLDSQDFSSAETYDMNNFALRGDDFAIGGYLSNGSDLDMDNRLMSYLHDAWPYIRANGDDGPVEVVAGEVLSVSVELLAGNQQASSVDYWLLVATPFGSGFYHYDVASTSWRPGVTPTFQGPAVDLAEMEVLSMTTLPVGSYTFYFGIDTLMNGRPDLANAFVDTVEVTVTPP